MNAAVWLLVSLLCGALVCGAAMAEEPAGDRASESAAAPADLIDLNHADVAELTKLPGIGQKRAEAILAFREAHGGFQSVSQLLNIKGIGRAMLRKLRALVTISSNPAGSPSAASAPRQTTAGGSGELHRVR